MDHLWTDYQNHDLFGGMSSLFISIEVLKKFKLFSFFLDNRNKICLHL